MWVLLYGVIIIFVYGITGWGLCLKTCILSLIIDILIYVANEVEKEIREDIEISRLKNGDSIFAVSRLQLLLIPFEIIAAFTITYYITNDLSKCVIPTIIIVAAIQILDFIEKMIRKINKKTQAESIYLDYIDKSVYENLIDLEYNRLFEDSKQRNQRKILEIGNQEHY